MSDDIRSDQYKTDRLHINGKKPDWFQDEYFDECDVCKECLDQDPECKVCGEG